MPSTDDILTPQEAADSYRVSAKTIIRLIKNGAIPAVKIGKQWRIRRRDLEVAFSPTPPAQPSTSATSRRKTHEKPETARRRASRSKA